MVDTTWTNGGGDGKASTAANWSNGIDVGYNVIFDGTSTANCTFDYGGQLGTFAIGAGYSGTIAQSSDMYISGYSQAGGVFTGSLSKWMYLENGIFVQSAGTLTGDNLRLNLINATLQLNNGVLAFLKTDGDSYITSVAGKWSRGFINTGNLEISNNFQIGLSSSPYTVSNTGFINGTLIIYGYGNNAEINPGDGNDIRIALRSGVSASTVLSLGSDSSGITNIYSEQAVNTMTLNLNGHSLTATTITVGTRGILSNSAATDSVVSCASFDSSAGTFTEANTQVILNGNGTIKTGAHKFDELVQRDGVITTLGSNITVTNEFDTAGSFVQGAYSITHENPGKRLMAPMINPIVRNPKRSPLLNNRFTRNIELEVV